MASDANDDFKNCRERLRWGDVSTKVYTRRKKDTVVNHVSPVASVVPPENNHVLQTLEAEKAKPTEQQQAEAEPQTQEGDHHGVDLREVRYRVEPVSNGEHDGGSSVQATLTNGTDRQPNDVEAAPREVVKPVVCRIEDRVRISLAGVRSTSRVVEIRDLRRTLESELVYVRSLVKKLEAKECQFTLSNNNGSIVAAVPQYMGSAASVINSRSLMRVNSEVGSVGHSERRPFRRPSLSVVVNNHEILEKEKRTPKANPYYKNSEFLLAKDRLPSERETNKSGKKHRSAFRFDKHKNKVYKSCTDLLERLMKHKHGWVFNVPVNAQALGLRDYHDIIKHPMDLGTIKTRLLSHNWYKSPKEFAEDVRLVFSNAMIYNPKGQDVHVMAEQLSQIFEERWAVIEAKYNPRWRPRVYHDAGLPTPTSRKAPHPHPHPFFHDPVPSYGLTHTPRVNALERSESMKKPSYFAHVARTPVPRKPKAKDPNKRDMTYEEKQKLSGNLENLPPEKLDAIVQIVKKRSSAVNQNNEEIEVDIDSVDVETLWELDRFVINYKKSLSKIKRKAELAHQARVRAAESAPTTSSGPVIVDSLKESKTGEMRTSAPSTNVEGGRQADNACSSSSSSSSSSDSGSSSSDSDSDSSSTCGSDAGH